MTRMEKVQRGTADAHRCSQMAFIGTHLRSSALICGFIRLAGIHYP